jgi:TniQ
MSFPVITHPYPGEALLGFVARFAGLNHRTIPEVNAVLGTSRLHLHRAVDDHVRDRIADLFALSPDSVRDMTLDRYPDDLRGDPSTGYVHDSVQGWAMHLPTGRCPACHQEGRPWLVDHQLGLFFVCPTHRRYLQPLCSACPTYHPLTSAKGGRCRHHTEPTAPVSRRTLQAQELATDLVRAATAGDPVALRQSAALRAAVAIETLHLALSAAPTDPRFPKRRQGPRLGRPPASAEIRALAITEGMSVVDAAGQVDSDWANQRLTAIQSGAPAVVGHLRPFARRLGIHLESEPAGLNIHQQWARLFRRARGLRERGLITAVQVPSSLRLPNEPFDTPWLTTLSRSALLFSAVTEQALTPSIHGFGYSQHHITAVIQRLQDAPTHDDVSAWNRVLGAPPKVNYPELRRAQSKVPLIDNAALRRERLTIAGTPTVNPGVVAAIWLYCTITESHPVTVPWLDGRASPGVAQVLRRWEQEADPEEKLRLHQLNESLLRDLSATRETVAVAASTPRRSAG